MATVVKVNNNTYRIVLDSSSEAPLMTRILSENPGAILSSINQLLSDNRRIFNGRDTVAIDVLFQRLSESDKDDIAAQIRSRSQA